jgi:hypothetical protein
MNKTMAKQINSVVLTSYVITRKISYVHISLASQIDRVAII